MFSNVNKLLNAKQKSIRIHKTVLRVDYNLGTKVVLNSPSHFIINFITLRMWSMDNHIEAEKNKHTRVRVNDEVVALNFMDGQIILLFACAGVLVPRKCLFKK